jgi:hypothetical protein
MVLYLIVGAPVILADVGLGFSIHSMSDSSSGSGSDSGTASDAGILMCVIGMALSLVFLNFCVVCCSTGIALRQVRGEHVRPADIFAGMNRWIAVAILNILLALILAAGSLVLGLGFFVACGFLMPAFGMVSDGESPLKGIFKSFRLMKSDWIQASLFSFVFALISVLLSAATFGLGLLVVLPMVYIISAIALRDGTSVPRRFDLEQPSRWVQGVWPPAPATHPLEHQNPYLGSYQPDPAERPADPNQDQY